MQFLLIIPAVLLIICAFREIKVTGTFKAFGVYGRLKAYLFIDMLAVGIASIVLAFMDKPMIGSKLVSILAGIGFLVIAVLIYLSTLAKCPDFLKGSLLISMLITGFGVTAKIAVFFVGAVWVLTGPQQITGSDGNTYLKHGSDIYTMDGKRVGNTNGAGGFTILTDSDGNPVETNQHVD